MKTAQIACWNVNWAKPDAENGQAIQQILRKQKADVVCVTEGYTTLLPPGGYLIESHEDYGYPIKAGRRKVILWSKNKWRAVDCVGDESLPTGRYVSGKTDTQAGPLTVIGVCISWPGAHVNGGRRDRKRWEDHEAYLSGLRRILPSKLARGRLIVVGDFNQRIPRKYTPKRVHEKLLALIGDKLKVATEGEVAGLSKQVIDHLAHTPDMRAQSIVGWENVSDDGLKLSDHSGWSAKVGLRK